MYRFVDYWLTLIRGTVGPGSDLARNGSGDPNTFSKYLEGTLKAMESACAMVYWPASICGLSPNHRTCNT